MNFQRIKFNERDLCCLQTLFEMKHCDRGVTALFTHNTNGIRHAAGLCLIFCALSRLRICVHRQFIFHKMYALYKENSRDIFLQQSVGIIQ